MRLYCDLHIHSCLSPCGDELMTPNNIAGMAMLKGLDAIAVADHNSARNLPALAKTCAAMGVLLLPAMEITTAEEAHLLAYFPTVEAAVDFSGEIHAFLPPIPNRPDLFGPQQVLDENDEQVDTEEFLLLNALSLSLDELVERINARGGAAVPAHINRGNNGLLNVLGFLSPGLEIAAVEVWRALPCPLDVSSLRVLHSSDAHYLENMLEREVFYDVAEKSVAALFEYVEDIKNNAEINAYIRAADKVMDAIGYTEHSFAHVTRAAMQAADILETLGYSERTRELAKIAGYMHDIGNAVNRHEHALTGAVMAFRILDNLGMPAEEIAQVVSAIGNHDEGTGAPVNEIAAALILADKGDVRRSRVRPRAVHTGDIHDRVNYAVESSSLVIGPRRDAVTLCLTNDTSICAVMDYFEIFLTRMLLCRRAAEFLGLKFKLLINDITLL